MIKRNPPAVSGKSEKPKWKDILGPGLITGASDDDPSGIATYSQAGAQFGYSLSWTLLLSYPLMCAIQRISAEIGRVTGYGIAGNLRRHYPAWILYAIVGLLIVANTINIGADLGAMAASINLLMGGPTVAYVIGFAVVTVYLQIYVKYARYVAVLKWLTLSLFAYVATVFAVHVPWTKALIEFVWPNFHFTSAYITVIVAVFGTTISPYLFFWQAGSEVEREQHKNEPFTPARAAAELYRIKLDTYVGMAASNLVALFIILTAAATLHAHGITDIQTSAQAAEALRPIAGRFAYIIFALGIIGTGMLALPVLSASAAYALGEVRGWPVGLAQTPRQGRAFYGTIAVATAIGALLNVVNIDPIKALFWSAVINGVVAVPVMVMLMLMAVNRKIMGNYKIKTDLKIVGWIATLVMAFVAVAMCVTWKN